MKVNKILFSFIYNIATKTQIFSEKAINYINREKAKTENKNWLDRFGDKDKILFSIDGIKINLYKDSILSKFIYDGFEQIEIDFVLKCLNQNDIFLDVGSNIGLFSLFASRIVGSEGKVICFEPAPETYRRLLENIELNQLKNIETRNLGLSDSEGELKFYYSDTGFDAWNSFAPTNDYRLNKSIDVKVSTLDKQLEFVDKSLIKIIKIDVEGWEKFVLKGGKDYFKNYSPIVMVEFTEENTFNAGYPIHDIFFELEQFGYHWYRIDSGQLVKEIKKMNYPYINLIAKKD